MSDSNEPVSPGCATSQLNRDDAGSRTDSNQPVSLGCGTLILIAIIVSTFSNVNNDEKQQLRHLRSDVRALTEEVREMRKRIDTENAAAGKVAAPAIQELD